LTTFLFKSYNISKKLPNKAINPIPAGSAGDNSRHIGVRLFKYFDFSNYQAQSGALIPTA